MYLLSSVKEAESMSNKGLRQALKSAGVYCEGWDRASLVSTWLSKWGTREYSGILVDANEPPEIHAMMEKLG